MENEKKFKTKTGFCHILPEKIVLTRGGFRGDLAKVTVGNNIRKILTIYSIMAPAFLFLSFKAFTTGNTIFSIIWAILGIYLIYGILISLNNSATPVIDRTKIKDIKFKKGIKGLTRSRFEVIFEDNGKIKKRLIIFPGILAGGDKETKVALHIMEEENLLRYGRET